MTSFPLKPRRLHRDGDSLRIEWNDNSSTRATWRDLRQHCPCATCNEERAKPPDPFRILSDRELQAGTPEPSAMKPIGHYAYQIIWNDGHDTGIYTLELLHKLSAKE